MKSIIESAFITGYNNSERFMEAVQEQINKMQEMKLEVEIQTQKSVYCKHEKPYCDYTALIIGRKDV